MSEHSALVFGRILRSDGSVSEISLDEFSSQRNAGHLIWLHFDYENPTSQSWIREQSGIDETLVDYLIEDDSRPGIFSSENQLLLVLRAINFNENQDAEDLVSIRSYFTDHLILTLRRRKVHIFEKMRERLDAQNGFSDSCEFILAFLDELVSDIGKHSRIMDDKIQDIEDRLEQKPDTELFDPCIAVQKNLMRLKRFLHPQKTTIQQIEATRMRWFSEDLVPSLHNLSELHLRYVEDIDYFLERTKIMKEEIASLRSEETNRRLYLLALVTVVFLPTTLITGLLGVNLAGIPFSANKFAFGGLCLLLGIVFSVIYLNFKKKKWF